MDTKEINSKIKLIEILLIISTILIAIKPAPSDTPMMFSGNITTVNPLYANAFISYSDTTPPYANATAAYSDTTLAVAGTLTGTKRQSIDITNYLFILFLISAIVYYISISDWFSHIPKSLFYFFSLMVSIFFSANLAIILGVSMPASDAFRSRTALLYYFVFIVVLFLALIDKASIDASAKRLKGWIRKVLNRFKPVHKPEMSTFQSAYKSSHTTSFMAQKSANKEERVKISAKMMKVLEFLNETELNTVHFIKLHELFDPLLINSLITKGFLEYSGDHTVRLTSMGFNFLIQQKINGNLDKLNTSVIKLNKSSDELNLLTLYLIALTAILIIKEYPLNSTNSIYIIILVLILPVISWIMTLRNNTGA